MFDPVSTYRLQFNKDFTFKHVEEQLPYLHELGVKTIYASPIFKSIPGSSHGYDGVDPLQLHPETGTEKQLLSLAKKIKKLGMTWIQDIVPNHMAFHPQNQWLMDVLKNGKESAFWTYFDIDFPHAGSDPRLMVPFLGESLDEAISQQKLKLLHQNNQLWLAYGDQLWPCQEQTKKSVLQELDKKNLKQQIQKINQDPILLRNIANQQHYRLCHWQETEKQINYRRFFTVNSLICLNIQNDQVFQSYHSYIFKLLELGVFQGLRIDHVDGLADPKAYLEKLREKVGPEVYIVVEKILETEEELPTDWPIQGNTGYDFLAVTNNLLTNRAAEAQFDQLYVSKISKPLNVDEQIAAKKSVILYEQMAGELENLVTLFFKLKLNKSYEAVIEKVEWKAAIANFLIYCPVYRYYGAQFPLDPEEQKAVLSIFDRMPKDLKSQPAVNRLKELLLSTEVTPKKSVAIASFYQRCMQFSGPLMAKGVEDTLMYTYHRFIAHTEVGDAPDAFGLSVADFHKRMQLRVKTWPLSFNATATHDTKRGEDVRARLNALADVPERWTKLVVQLKKLCTPKQTDLDLHWNDVYLMLQTIVGTMPFNEQELDEYTDRLAQYVEKALREAKKRSEWASPNQPYEDALKEFTLNLIKRKNEVYSLLRACLNQITDFSIVNSLVQSVLKFTCPGIPDTYQGTELWDLSMVDPDNRRPVDYGLRKKIMAEIGDKSISALWEQRIDGGIKLWLTKRLLDIRSNYQQLFTNGDYQPLEVKGSFKTHVIAYARQYESKTIVVVLPLGLGNVSQNDTQDPALFDWKDTSIVWPAALPNRWKSLLTDNSGQKDIVDQIVPVKELFLKLPLAVVELVANPSPRGSGVLLPVFSLPGNFGIGDLGKEAREFITLLARAKQKYWQLLPLNPITAGRFYSPYASYSAMAGNPLLISLTTLQEQGLLTKNELKKAELAANDKVDYNKAFLHKVDLLKLAYLRASEDKKQHLNGFEDFCQQEANWLTDFALFAVLRDHHSQLPWNKWPKDHKLRKASALKSFSTKFANELQEVKWIQFIFQQQWKSLKIDANQKGVQILGDLPFYVDYDSADVWANPSLFKLDRNLEMEVVAGVPPDDFNTDGQRWGLPVFDWQKHTETDFNWWITRIKKNLELYDVLRLDHFRAFHTYWEISTLEETAKNGKWIKAPGEAILKKICQIFKELPFVAEDLGGDMEGPIELRKQFKLAGMKVLQFGFGGDLPDTTHLPHQYPDNNCLVYTGTHDNNTVTGWYMRETNETAKRKISQYLNKNIDENNVHMEMIRLALSSSANLSVIQLQDLLGLGEQARMNAPATIDDNWQWRLQKNQLKDEMIDWLRFQTELFGRD